jgi:predicted GIY-YIG superfamily endonuclease
MAWRGPPDDSVGDVYLIHFSGRTAAGHQHYLGWSGDVCKRFARHESGQGALETRKAITEGLKLTLAQMWRGTPADERRIKEERRRVRRGFAILCPFCEVEDELAAGLVRGMGPPTLKVVRPRAEYAPADDVPSTGAS